MEEDEEVLVVLYIVFVFFTVLLTVCFFSNMVLMRIIVKTKQIECLRSRKGILTEVVGCCYNDCAFSLTGK